MFPTVTVHTHKDRCRYCNQRKENDPKKLAEHEEACRIIHHLQPDGKPIREPYRKKATKSDGVIRTTGGTKSDDYDVEKMAALVEGGGGSEKNEKKKKAADRGGSEKNEKKKKAAEKKESVAAGNGGGSDETEKNAVVEKSGGCKEEKKKRMNEKKKKRRKKDLAAERVNDSVDFVLSSQEWDQVSSHDRDKMASFSEITSASFEESYLIMSSNNFNLVDALSAFYDKTTTTNSEIPHKSNRIKPLSETSVTLPQLQLIEEFSEEAALSDEESYRILSSHNFNFEEALSAWRFNNSIDDAALVARQREWRDRQWEERQWMARQRKAEENVVVDSPAPSSPSSSSSSSSSSSISPPPSFEYEADEAAPSSFFKRWRKFLLNQLKARRKLDARENAVQIREDEVKIREDEVKIREDEVQIREWEARARDFEFMTLDETVRKREERVVARENRAMEFRDKLKIFEGQLIKQKEDAVKFKEGLTRQRYHMVLMELGIKTREASLANDWTAMEKAMIQRWKNAKALEEELWDLEKKLQIREEAVMKSEGKKNNYDK